MSEDETEKRRPGVPKYFYWGKTPPKPILRSSSPMSNEQRKFRFVVGAFTIAKVLAMITFLVLIFGRV